MSFLRLPLSTERLSLRANFSWAFLGNTIFSFSQWGLIVVLAKLGSPELVGEFALANAITAPIFMFSNMDLVTAQSTDVQNIRTFGDYLGLRSLLSLVSLVFIGVILLFSGYRTEIILMTVIVSLTRFVEAISEVSYGLLQKQERLDLVARSLIIRGLVPLFTITITFYLFDNFLIALGTQLIVWGGALCFFDLHNVRRWQSAHPRFNSKVLSGLFWLTLPLGIISGLNSLSSQIPRYALEHFGSERDLGIFSAVAALGLVASLFTVSLSRAALPRLSHLYAQQAFSRFVRLLLRLMGLGFLIGVLGVIGAALFGKLFLTLAYTKEYAAHTDVLMITAVNVGVITTFTFVGTALGATRRFAVQQPIHIAKVFAISGACLLLIPSLGAVGAAWATVVGSALSGSIYSVILWRTLEMAKRNQA
jgi:O-antigen/teichoic acid export membrane protein